MKIKSVAPMSDYRVLVSYENGLQCILDVKPWINGDWYGELHDVEYFNKVRPHTLLGAIEWPNGQDIAPEDIIQFGVKISEPQNALYSA